MTTFVYGDQSVYDSTNLIYTFETICSATPGGKPILSDFLCITRKKSVLRARKLNTTSRKGSICSQFWRTPKNRSSNFVTAAMLFLFWRSFPRMLQDRQEFKKLIKYTCFQLPKCQTVMMSFFGIFFRIFYGLGLRFKTSFRVKVRFRFKIWIILGISI